MKWRLLFLLGDENHEAEPFNMYMARHRLVKQWNVLTCTGGICSCRSYNIRSKFDNVLLKLMSYLHSRESRSHDPANMDHVL